MSRPIIETASEPTDGPADEGDEAECRAFTVQPDEHGGRLDRVLARVVPEFSRSYLQQLVAQQAVVLDGRTAAKPALKVRVGSSGQVTLTPTPQSQAFVAEPVPLETVYEDAHLRVIDKPAGLVVHPAAGNWSGTVLNGLLALDAQAAQLPRAGIVHRLDKDTSGLMVVARSRVAMDALVQAIAARTVARQYLALAHRAWTGGPRTVDAPVGRDPRNRLRMAVVDGDRHPGKPARTGVECLDRNEAASLLRCTLETGRTHQIRVHLAHSGHPLVGDVLYGGRPQGGLVRQALHAARLAFAHPATGQALEFASPLPDDLRAGIASQGLHYTAG